MILKMIGIRRSIILQLMITIFTMINKIEEKLLLLKAKKFADNLEETRIILYLFIGK